MNIPDNFSLVVVLRVKILSLNTRKVTREKKSSIPGGPDLLAGTASHALDPARV
jgi:hypothetical protein